MPGFTVTRTIEVGEAPHGIRFSDAGDTAYVALAHGRAMAVVDLRTMTVAGRIPAGESPLDAFRLPGGEWLVTQFDGDELITTGGSGRHWRVGKTPTLFAPQAVGGLVYVVSEFADTLTVFDTRQAAIVARYPTGKRPYPADITADGVLAFVPNMTDGTVTVIDLLNGEIAATTPVCAAPAGGALSADEVSYIVACGGSNELAYLNTASYDVVARVKDRVGPRPFSLAVTPDGRYALVINAGGSTVSVLDVAGRRIVGELTTGRQPIVVRMHPDGRRALVSNELSNTLSLIETPPAAPRRARAAKNEVVVSGTVHDKHLTGTQFSTDVLRRLLRTLHPDYVLVEIAPNRFERAMEEFRATGTVTEPRVRRFPEYVNVLFPLTREMTFTIVPTAGWSRPMDQYRTAAMERIARDPGRREDWARYEAGNRLRDSIVTVQGGEENPRYIHTDAYDAAQEVALAPYNRFNDELGTGGWTTINRAHFANIARALDEHRGEGKRFVITYGAGHKGWFLRELRKRHDIVLLDVVPFLDRGGAESPPAPARRSRKP